MLYKNVFSAAFISRPNRFIARCLLNGEEIIAHVPNTGRCKEILRPGAKVILKEAENPRRKTAFSLIAAEKEGRLINIDSQAPNRVVKEALLNRSLILPGWEGEFCLQPEALLNSSRIDFALKGKNKLGWLEVKGVTLENGGIASFPDAPTQRGLRHVEELIKAAQKGEDAFIIFLIQMEGVKYFTPNNITQPEFGEALKRAKKAGVKLLAYDSSLDRDFLILKERVKIDLA